MDEKQENPSAIDNDESQGSEGVNIQVKTPEASTSAPGPIINDIQAPPQQPEAAIEESDAAAVDSAVKEISDDSAEGPKEQLAEEESSVEEAPEDNHSDGSEEPEVKEAPESTETEPQTEGDSESQPSPFAQKTEESAVPLSVPTTPQSMSNNEQSLPHEHRNNKKFAIVITLVVALLLAGAAVYVYVSAQENTSETKKTTTDPNAQNIAEVKPATPTDVDTTLADIDQTIQSIDDEADLNEDSISDTALGL